MLSLYTRALLAFSRFTTFMLVLVNVLLFVSPFSFVSFCRVLRWMPLNAESKNAKAWRQIWETEQKCGSVNASVRKEGTAWFNGTKVPICVSVYAFGMKTE